MNDNIHVINLISNAVGTGVAEIVTLPICAVKTNYQTDVGNMSVKQVVAKIYRTSGIRGFYSASVPAFSAQVINATGKYTGYNYLKETTSLPTPLCGLISGTLVSVITHPFDFIRISWQRNVMVVDEIKQRGPTVFYRGYTKNISKVVVGTMTYLPIYDKLKELQFGQYQASFLTAVISTTLLQPIDYAKTVNIAGGNWWHGLKIQNYFKGYHVNMMRIVPHFMIMMAVTERLKEKLKLRD